MLELRTPITIKKAIDRVIEQCQLCSIITVPLEDSDGYYLAENIRATHDVPPFNRSPFDGFAIRSIDSKGASKQKTITFNVIDYIGAGQVSPKELGAYDAVRIMTGAALPTHADAIVMLEQSREYGDTFTINKQFVPLENVSLQGEDAKNEDIIVPAGTYIHPGTIALLATFGYTYVQVVKKPVVGILATGTELLNVEDELEPGKIRDSNGPMIVAQLKSMGIKSRLYGMIEDDLKSCYDVVQQALAETDCVITTGGVSVGDFDFLPEVYEQSGAHVLFNKVAMRPGSVTTVAEASNKLLFGLSGNPSSCFTGFELFVRPAIRKMMGSNHLYLPQVKARLSEDFLEPNPFTRFIRGYATFNGQHVTVRSAGFNGPNAVTSIANANVLIVLPPGTKPYTQGTEVTILLLGVVTGSPEFII